MVRYLRPAAFTAAALALLLATDGTAAQADEPPERPATGSAAVRPAVGAGFLGAAARTALPAARTARAPGAATALYPPRVSPPSFPRLPPPLFADSGRGGHPQVPQTVYTGAGFDACSAPPLDAVQAWTGTAPYGSIGIYTSGSQRGCDQPELDADWVRQVRALGWRLVPTHVGLQAPCSTDPSKPAHIDPEHAVQQGRAEAAEAVRGVRAVGLGPGAPVYLDMEAYSPDDPDCSQAVVDFTVGWTEGLHDAGYWSGFYSSVDSGIRDLVTAAEDGTGSLPDAVWYARWNDRPSTDGDGVLPEDLWTDHQRAHQTHGDVEETYGGVTLAIDRDQLDTLVAG